MHPQAFDTYATVYDTHFTGSLIGKAQRARVYTHVQKHIDGSIKTALELNCGTGEDAIWLASKGLTVLATDISEGMLQVARQKKINELTEFKRLEIQNINTLQPKTFDLVFSNFGGLNCLAPNEMIAFSSHCSGLQNKGNKLALVIMGKKCLWEIFYYRVKRDVKKRNRRLAEGGAETAIDGRQFTTYYYSPKEITALFANNYRLVSLKPIGFFVPPSYLETFFSEKTNLFRCLVWLERLFGNFKTLSNYADHFLIVLEKK